MELGIFGLLAIISGTLLFLSLLDAWTEKRRPPFWPELLGALIAFLYLNWLTAGR